MKRKDASSVLLAIVIALVISQMLAMVSDEPVGRLIGASITFADYRWRANFLHPIVYAAVQLLALELLCRIYVFIHGFLEQSRKK